MKFYKYQQLLFQCLLLIAFIGTVSAQKFSPKYLKENDKKLLRFVTEAPAYGWLEFKRDTEGVKAGLILIRCWLILILPLSRYV